MPTVGPVLPPHLQAKRKRKDEAHDTASTPPKRRRNSSSSSNDTKPNRVIGPTAPPADPSQLPPTVPSPEAESSSSDDDFGPSLPPAPGSTKHAEERRRQQNLDEDLAAKEAAKKPQREEWMLVPPKQGDWTSKVDPTKIKARKFNTGKGAKAPGQGAKAPGQGISETSLWSETPEQKRQRLEDEVMGVKKPAQLGPEEKRDTKQAEEARETQRRINEYNEKSRGGSLYSEHKKVGPKEKEDDPSARAFDREKDMGLAQKIGHAQKRELLTKAKDFESRFSSGSYL